MPKAILSQALIHKNSYNMQKDFKAFVKKSFGFTSLLSVDFAEIALSQCQKRYFHKPTNRISIET